MRSLIVLVLLGAEGLRAQAPTSRILDRGAFLISINGQRAGREDFTIEGTPGARAMEYVATATIVIGDQKTRTKALVRLGGSAHEIQRPDEGRWIGEITRGRVRARVTNARGHSEKEYVVSEGAVILEDDVFHQYFFVVQRAAGASVPVVVPLRNRQVVLAVTSGGQETVSIGGKNLEARKLTFTEPSGATRDLWVDATGRVLKVAIPARGLVALRDEPPPP